MYLDLSRQQYYHRSRVLVSNMQGKTEKLTIHSGQMKLDITFPLSSNSNINLQQ